MQYSLNHNAIVLARESRGLSQSALAKTINVPQTLISRMEHGIKTDITKHILEKLSEHLQYPEDFFYQQGHIVPISAEIQYRKGSKLKISDQKRTEAIANITRLQINKLLQDIEIETNLKQFDLDDLGWSPVDVAKAIRTFWKVPRGPMQNVTELIEAAGIIIIQDNFNTRFIDGFSLYNGEKYPLIFISNDIPGDRYRFTLAHELGHILMHNIRTPDMEEEANLFASEFLMPEYDITDDLTNISFKKLADLKQYWRVSMAAIARRAWQLKTISDVQYRYINMQMSSAGYRLKEPFELNKEKPRLLDEIIKLHFNSLNYTVEDLSKFLCFNTDEFRSKYLSHYNKFQVLHKNSIQKETNMPIERKERPNCRKAVEDLLVQYHCELEDLLDRERLHQLGLNGISDGLKVQVRKMIEEKNR